MHILIDVGHPGHVHLFAPFSKKMIEQGHNILFTYRQKEFEKELLESYGFKNVSFGKHYNSKIGKIWGLVKFNLLMLVQIIRFKPHIVMSHGSIYAAQMAWFTCKKHISLEDSGNMEQIKLYLPFTKAVLTPDVLPENLGRKQIRYKGYHELAYLHPNVFNVNKHIKKELGLKAEDKYAVLRFVSWNATHDFGHKGFSSEQKEEVIEILQKHFKLFITSEAELPDHLKKHQIKLHPSKIHHVLSAASLVVSEGATIASESGVLGVPTIYVNSIVRSYNEDQEYYGTVFNFRNGDGVIEKITELTTNYNSNDFKQRREKLLKDKIDVTAFMVWFVENYPDSAKIMKENPDYQKRFK